MWLWNGFNLGRRPTLLDVLSELTFGIVEMKRDAKKPFPLQDVAENP